MASRAYENPLIPHARMKAIFEAMLAARLLDARNARRRAKPLGRGLEACWVAPAIGLRDAADDRFSAGPAGPALDMIAGLPLKPALAGEASPRRLDLSGAPAERIAFAVGAAAGWGAAGVNARAMLIFIRADEITPVEWTRMLKEALRRELPVVFVALPGRGAEPGAADRALDCGVPGVPVDAADAIALYRVAQESLGRARAGGGPALIEGVRFPATGDPITLLARQLAGRRIATERWIATTQERIQKRLTLPLSSAL